MQRILHVVNIMDRGGVETLLMNIYRNIDRQQTQFDFLTHPYHQDYIQEYEDEIIAVGGRVYKAPSFSKHPLKYRNYIQQFFKEHDEYHVVHAHNLDLAASSYMATAKQNGKYLIAHAHNTKERGSSLRREVLRLNHRFIRRYPDHFFACSEEAARFMFGSAIASSNKCEIFYNGIDVTKYYVDDTVHQHEKEILFPNVHGPLFGTVGRLATQKNQSFLLDVFAEILHNDKTAYLALIGKGNLEQELRQKAIDLGIESNVLFIGSVSNVPDYLKAFDVFLFPSIYEGLGMAAVEAQASGLPTIISSSVPSLACCTDLAYSLDINDGASKWAEAALQLAKQQVGHRTDRIEQVRNAGFDIAKIASELSTFYKLHGEIDNAH